MKKDDSVIQSVKETEITRIPVDSSNIKSVGHTGNVLEVEFYPRQGSGKKDGPIWRYWPIATLGFKAMLKSQSIGAWFHQHIKSNSSVESFMVSDSK